MSYMKSVDIVLDEYKLSDAQKNAVVELIAGGFNTAKANTIGSLVKRGLVVVDENGQHFLEEDFHAKIKEGYSQPEPREKSFHEELMASVAELEEALKGDPWGEQPPVSVIDLEPTVSQVVTFDKDWAPWERELAGFEVVNYFRNTDRWHGLTAKEIKEDIKTARPLGREGRRQFERQVRKVTKQLVGAL